GGEPQLGSGIEPIEIWAHQPKMMIGMGRFNQAIRKGKSVDERIKNLVELKGAQMIGCEYCVDLGSQICRNSGFSGAELLARSRATAPVSCSPSAKRSPSTSPSG